MRGGSAAACRNAGDTPERTNVTQCQQKPTAMDRESSINGRCLLCVCVCVSSTFSVVNTVTLGSSKQNNSRLGIIADTMRSERRQIGSLFARLRALQSREPKSPTLITFIHYHSTESREWRGETRRQKSLRKSS